MLGWEYPPMVTGGLGVACYGLVKAMSNEAQVTLILPRKEKVPQVDDVEIIGLNHFKAAQEIYSVAEPQPAAEAVMPSIAEYAKDTFYVPVDLARIQARPPAFSKSMKPLPTPKPSENYTKRLNSTAATS